MSIGGMFTAAIIALVGTGVKEACSDPREKDTSDWEEYGDPDANGNRKVAPPGKRL